MVSAKFSSDMISGFKDTIGQTFLSFECAKEDISGSTYGNIRLNFSDFSIDLTNEQKYFRSIDDDISCLSCIVVRNGERFIPAVDTDTEIVEVREIVHEIELISDIININYGETVLEIDSALVFFTDKGYYVFGRTEWFSEVILISHNIEYSKIYSIENVIESWSNDGTHHVDVNRINRKI